MNLLSPLASTPPCPRPRGWLRAATALALAISVSLLAAGAGAQDEVKAASAASAPPVYSPAVRESIPRRVLWGDTHLHTRLSQDAYSFGVTLDSDDAYRFAKGGVIEATHGQRARLDRPLDFLVIADHASGMGSMDALVTGNEKLLANERLAAWRDLLREVGGAKAGLQISEEGRMQGWPVELNDPEILRPAWQQVLEAAELHDDPGRFTALIG